MTFWINLTSLWFYDSYCPFLYLMKVFSYLERQRQWEPKPHTIFKSRIWNKIHRKQNRKFLCPFPFDFNISLVSLLILINPQQYSRLFQSRKASLSSSLIPLAHLLFLLPNTALGWLTALPSHLIYHGMTTSTVSALRECQELSENQHFTKLAPILHAHGYLFNSLISTCCNISLSHVVCLIF